MAQRTKNSSGLFENIFVAFAMFLLFGCGGNRLDNDKNIDEDFNLIYVDESIDYRDLESIGFKIPDEIFPYRVLYKSVQDYSIYYHFDKMENVNATSVEIIIEIPDSVSVQTIMFEKGCNVLCGNDTMGVVRCSHLQVFDYYMDTYSKLHLLWIRATPTGRSIRGAF